MTEFLTYLCFIYLFCNTECVSGTARRISMKWMQRVNQRERRARGSPRAQ